MEAASLAEILLQRIEGLKIPEIRNNRMRFETCKNKSYTRKVK
jgi:hypothetical protein